MLHLPRAACGILSPVNLLLYYCIAKHPNPGCRLPCRETPARSPPTSPTHAFPNTQTSCRRTGRPRRCTRSYRRSWTPTATSLSPTARPSPPSGTASGSSCGSWALSRRLARRRRCHRAPGRHRAKRPGCCRPRRSGRRPNRRNDELAGIAFMAQACTRAAAVVDTALPRFCNVL